MNGSMHPDPSLYGIPSHINLKGTLKSGVESVGEWSGEGCGGTEAGCKLSGPKTAKKYKLSE